MDSLVRGCQTTLIVEIILHLHRTRSDQPRHPPGLPEASGRNGSDGHRSAAPNDVTTPMARRNSATWRIPAGAAAIA
jgi:hypothetical protein